MFHYIFLLRNLALSYSWKNDVETKLEIIEMDWNEFHVLLYSTITSTNVNNTNAYVMYLNALR